MDPAHSEPLELWRWCPVCGEPRVVLSVNLPLEFVYDACVVCGDPEGPSAARLVQQPGE